MVHYFIFKILRIMISEAAYLKNKRTPIRIYKRNFTAYRIRYQLSYVHVRHFYQTMVFYDANSTFIRFIKSLISMGFRMKQPTSKLGKISLNAS